MPSSYHLSLQRFLDAQNNNKQFDRAFNEITKGAKTSHWIWFILPQLKTLGTSENGRYYGINTFSEAIRYLRHSILFKRYGSIIEEISKQLITVDPLTLMGSKVDVNKLAASVTLFSKVAEYLTEIEKSQEYQSIIPTCRDIMEKIKDHSEVKSVELTLDFLEKNPPAVEIMNELKEYITTRKEEWSFHYNFLGLVSLIYFLQDMFFHTDHFNAKSRKVKIDAATKLIQNLTNENPPPFTLAEKKALHDGRLGKIVKEHGGLEKLSTLRINLTAQGQGGMIPKSICN